MRFQSLLRFLFIEYCVIVGLLLLVAPWSIAWDRAFLQLPNLALRDLLHNPFLRGAVSGFGLVHLVWVLHDLDLFLSRPKHDDQSSAS